MKTLVMEHGWWTECCGCGRSVFVDSEGMGWDEDDRIFCKDHLHDEIKV